MTIGHLQNTAHIAHGHLRQERTESDDLGDPIASVFFLNVVDDLLAPILTEVDVEIRHGHTFGVQEALEQQSIAQGVQIRDRQRISHQRARARATSRTDGNVLVLGPLDEVGNDQEITGEAHVLDDAQLELQPSLIFRHLCCMRDHRQPCGEAFTGLAAQLLHLVIRELRQDRVMQPGAIGAAPGDLDRVLDSFGQIREPLQHFCFGFQIMLGRQACPFGVVHIPALPDTHERVMGVGNVRAGIIDGVGRDQGQIQIIGQTHQSGLGGIFCPRAWDPICAMALDLDIESVREQCTQASCKGACILARADQTAKRPICATGQADQPICPAFKAVQRHMRQLGRISIQKRRGGQPHQVLITSAVLRQQNQVRGRQWAFAGLGLRRLDSQFTADNRLQARLRRALRELQRAKEVVRVRHRCRREPGRCHKAGQLFHRQRPLQQRVRRVDAERDESRACHPPTKTAFHAPRNWASCAPRGILVHCL